MPALSEHHAGGTNIGRTLVNGERLGGADVRERYFLGADFARGLRALSPGTFREVYGTYGPRSSLYAEMVFGNLSTVAHLLGSIPQVKIFAMRTPRALSLAEITRQTGIPDQEVRRFNPALTSRVPARATLYLPRQVTSFGRDVAFWRRPPGPGYASTLDEFLGLDVPPEEWDDARFDKVLSGFRRRFEATATEEGSVMATTLAYVLEDRRVSRQAQIVAEFRSSERIRHLFQQARQELEGASRAQQN